MTHKARKHIWPGGLVMAIAVAGVLAVFAVLATSPGVTVAHEAADHNTACADMTEAEREAHNKKERAQALLDGRDPVLCADTTETQPTPTSTAVAPVPQTSGFVANAVAGRKVELKWRPIAGATGYVIRYRNLDEGGSWTTVNVSADTLMHTLEDDDLEDGALYEVRLRASGQTAVEESVLQVLGPIIQFSSETPFEANTGDNINWRLPRAVLAKGDTVRYSIVPALPKGLSYDQETGKNHVTLSADEHPYITGGVAHTVGASRQFYRLTGCDVEDGIPDYDSCDTHIFEIIISPANVKPLADVIRDREYEIGAALDTGNPLNQFPEVGVGGASNNYEYSLLHTDDFSDLDLPGLEFDDEDRQLSGTPAGPKGTFRVTYRASRPGSSVYHEAEFTIHIVEIVTHVCRTGLNYEETLRVFNKTDKVDSANFTVDADAAGHYVLPIGEKGQQGTDKTSTRTFELITVKQGDVVGGANANVLPAGLQVVKLMVDEASVNPLNSLYTRQGPYTPTGAVTPQEMTDGRYADPEPDYPTTDNGYRLAIGVADASMLKEGEYLSCFIVHDTDDDTGETDSSAVVFDLNVLPNLSARDWVIELNGEGDMSELDVEEAFTTDASLLNYSVMYVDDGAAKNSDTGCIASAAANPKDIVSWSTVNDTVTFTAREVSATMTQRVQVKATLKTGGAEACVQVRITVLPEHMPTDLTAPTGINTCVAGDSACPGLAAGSVKVTWTNGANALSHLVLLFDTSDWTLAKPVATMQDSGDTTFSGVPAGSYIAVVVAYDANANVQLDLSGAITVAAGN